MAITRPSADQVRELAASLHMTMTPEEAAAYRALMDASFDAYDVVDALPDHIPPVKYPAPPAPGQARRRTPSAPGTGRAR
jgi:amidase